MLTQSRLSASLFIGQVGRQGLYPPVRDMAHVLFVDDEQSIRSTVATVLTTAGHGVEVASNGAQALGLMARRRPDVIVLDLMMPGMDGWAFLETLRTQTRWSEVPIIAASTLHTPQAVSERLGVRACLQKPFDPAVLLQAVERFSSRPATEGSDHLAGR